MRLMFSEPKREMFSLLALDTQWSLFTQLSSHQTEADTAGTQRVFAGTMEGWVVGEWWAGERTVGMRRQREGWIVLKTECTPSKTAENM